MNTRKTIMAAAIALTAGAFGFTGIAPSYAGAMSSAAPVEKSGWQQIGNGVEQVKHRKYHKKRWRYSRQRHGKRFRHRNRGYNHYYGGYWYPRPFWNSMGFGITIAPGIGSNSHLIWCDNRYRSYNPATDMFLGYDGEYHRCNSPYR